MNNKKGKYLHAFFCSLQKCKCLQKCTEVVAIRVHAVDATGWTDKGRDYVSEDLRSGNEGRIGRL